ncbi:7355_t:CDS:2 [Dentiscutata heterogama]|uniref:7355_t:CDS:1 n=1 Tax=Dentiscutata heterogama TaxID=1316150 RepID=A0ACA9KDX4_9GLOM|nr:7355_t:CDS:2 [Dentiscutata heterogama]
MPTTDFTNDPSATMSYKGRQIQVPANTILRNMTENQNEPIHNNSFYITWIPNYTLFHNGAEIFRLENQKHQAIKGD